MDKMVSIWKLSPGPTLFDYWKRFDSPATLIFHLVFPISSFPGEKFRYWIVSPDKSPHLTIGSASPLVRRIPALRLHILQIYRTVEKPRFRLLFLNPNLLDTSSPVWDEGDIIFDWAPASIPWHAFLPTTAYQSIVLTSFHWLLFIPICHTMTFNFLSVNMITQIRLYLWHCSFNH